MSKALGLVEVTGYLAAIDAADTALKAAKVTLVGLEKVKSGITTIKVVGDVGAVQAAVRAAAVEVDKLGLLRATHVIANVDEQVEAEFLTQNKNKAVTLEKTEPMNLTSRKEKLSPKEIEVSIEDKKATVEKSGNQLENYSDEISDNKKVNSNNDLVDYKQMKVEELRKLVRTLKIPNLTNKQIKFAKKDFLIELLLEYKK